MIALLSCILNDMTDTTPSTHATHKPRPLMDLLISIVIPSVILMKLSGEARLGADGALMLALAFPLGWGSFELLKYRKFNFIGLLKLDNQWLAIKEATIPGLIGIAVLVSTRTRYPLIRTMLFNKNVLNVDKIHERLEQAGNTAQFEARLLKATYWLSGTFFFSSAMNYVLAKWIVISPAGSEAFNAELGRMNLLSYPMIAIPSMIMLMAIFYYLWRTIHGLTGLKLEDVMANAEQEKQP
jgi:hypothetical protein